MAVTVTAPVVTQAVTGSVLDPNSFAAVFLQWGVVGVVAFLGLLFAYKANQKTEARADRLEAQLSNLHQETRDKIIPALVASTQTNGEVAEVLRDLLRDRDRR